MAITLRGDKGSPLSHVEMDTNFREFFYSSSVSPSQVILYKSKSLDAEVTIQTSIPSGQDTHIQIKSGSGISGADGVLTGSANFTFDYGTNVFKVTGSTNIKGNVEIDGALTAHTYITTTVSSSVLFDSGSTAFGDSLDDTHIFSGGLYIVGNIDLVDAIVATSLTGSLLSTNGVLSSSAQIASEISGSFTSVSASIASDIANLDTASLSSSLATAIALNSSTGSDHETRITLNTLTGSNHETLITRNTLTGSNHETRIDTLEAINYISGSSAGTAQGQFKLNGVDVNVKDLQTTSNVTFGQITGSSALINGALSATGDITAFFSSDERLKDNITPIEGALDKINQIGGYGFDWNGNSGHSGHDVGVIAQEIEKVLPEVVTTRDNGYLAVRYEKIVALLIQAIKEQQLQIDELKSKL